jgi:hypothetical protein
MGRVFFRTAVLAYAGLLIAGSWPLHGTPVIGPIARVADGILAGATLTSGMIVFNAMSPERSPWKLQWICHRVAGMQPMGEPPEMLYAPDCPPRGTRIGIDAFASVLQRVMQFINERELLESTRGGPDPRSTSVRRVTALGDWFCRSPEAGAGRFERLRFTQRRDYQNYDTGEYRSGPTLLCEWNCRARPAPLPTCQLMPHDAGAVVYDSRKP